MISISGSTVRSFIFPASFPAAFDYYQDFERSLSFLPHISIVQNYSEGRYRLRYSSVDSGIYRVNIYCDVGTIAGQEPPCIRISPLGGVPPVKSDVRLYTITGQGQYDSETVFHAAGQSTRIDYRIKISARLPVPLTLRLIPSALLNSAAHTILQSRIEEITTHFIEQSIKAYSGWKKTTAGGRS